MRHPLVPALLVVVLLGTYALAGAALADGSAPTPVAVDGTVDAPDGTPADDAVVLVGEYGLLSKFSPDELREVAAGAPQDVTVAQVADDGTFATRVPAERADAAVALSDDGISEVHRLGNRNRTLALQLHERRPQTVRTAGVPLTQGATETRLHVDLVNNGDAAVENLSVTVAGLPEGWSVAAVDTTGTYDADARLLTWASVPAGGEADATVALQVPADAAVDAYAVVLRGASDSHPVTVENGTVEVRPEETSGPTETYLGGDGTAAPGDAGTPPTGGTANPPPTPTSSPGLTGVAALAALALTAARLRGCC